MNKKLLWAFAGCLSVAFAEDVPPPASQSTPTFSQPTNVSATVDTSDKTEASDASEVFVSLTRTAVPRKNLPTNTTVISSEKIQLSNAVDVGEVLQKEGGVHIIRNAGRGSLATLNIRGFGSTRVLVLIDGRPVRDTTLGTIDLSQIAVDAIDHIEIVRGPSSALFGQNAAGGVVNIITKRGNQVMPKVAYTEQFGSYNTQTRRLQAGGKSGPVDVFASYSRNLQSGFRNNSDYSNHSGNATIGLTSPIGRTEVQGSFVQSFSGVPGGLNTHPSLYNGQIEKTSNSPNDRQNDRDRAARVEQTIVANDLKLSLRGFWGQHDRFNKYGTFIYETQGINQKGELQADFSNGVTLGTEVEENQLHINTGGSYRTTVWSYYSQYRTTQSEHFIGIFGLRGDRDSNFGESTNPRVTLIAQNTADPTLKLSANIGRAFRAPSFLDLFDPFSGNSSLKPERTWSYDVGGEWRFAEAGRTRLTLFYAETKDRIVLNASFVPYNIQRAKSRGIEWDGSVALTSMLDVNADYTFTEARASQAGAYDQDVPLTPRHRAGLHATLKTGPLSTRSSWRYIGKQNFGTFTNPGRTVVPDYLVWDIRLGYKPTKLFEIFFLTENILNRRYATAANPPSSTSGYYFPQPGRAYSGGITLTFW